MFENLRTCYTSLFIYVTDKNYRGIARLCICDKRRGSLAHLRYTARGGAYAVGIHRLNRVYYQDIRLYLHGFLDNLLNARIGINIQLVADRAEPLCAQLYLSARFLTRDIQHSSVAAKYVGYLKQQRRLAYTRLAGQQHDRAADYSSAEHTVKLAHSGSRAHKIGNGKLGEALRAALVGSEQTDPTTRRSGRSDSSSLDSLLHGVPRAAAGTFAEPFRAFI